MPAKRKDRSTSSKESTHSPDEKRTKEEGRSTYTVESDDEVFEALEMAEDLGKKIESVLQELKKLEKLDVIESRLNQVYTSIASIEATVSRIDSEVQVLKEKTSKLDKSVKELEESVNFNDEDISDIKCNTKKAEDEIKQLKKQILYMENYSRRENVKFVGIPENVEPFNSGNATNDGARSPSENTKEVVFNFLAEQLKIDRPGDTIEFQRVHRLGKSNSSKPRPIIARFLRFADKQLVMDQARKHLKGKNYHVFDDIPKELYDSRKGQLKKFQEAKEKGFNAYFSKAQPDKLFVNGNYIAPGQPIE